MHCATSHGSIGRRRPCRRASARCRRRCARVRQNPMVTTKATSTAAARHLALDSATRRPVTRPGGSLRLSLHFHPTTPHSPAAPTRRICIRPWCDASLPYQGFRDSLYQRVFYQRKTVSTRDVALVLSPLPTDHGSSVSFAGACHCPRGRRFPLRPAHPRSARRRKPSSSVRAAVAAQREARWCPRN